jgi:esterase/lipase superfamily enzyme
VDESQWCWQAARDDAFAVDRFSGRRPFAVDNLRAGLRNQSSARRSSTLSAFSPRLRCTTHRSWDTCILSHHVHQPSLACRRTALRALATAACTLTLCASVGGCASDVLSSGGATFDAAELSTNPTLLVATTRKPVNGARARPWYGSERAARLSVARAKLTPPSDGRFSLNAVGLDDWRLDAIEPASQIGDLYAEPGGTRDVLIYVHGFNQTFESAALDAARISDGIRFRGETMVFSWPSKANLFDYGYDRESAMWSRDALDQVLTGLMASPITGRIHVVAHSIGTMLTMEALRQIYARQPTAGERIGAVVFASPDIDLDVFTSSVARIGPLAGKITVVTATNDRALAVSGFLAGGITRVGAAEKAELVRLGLRVIDASAQGWGIINHDLFLSNAKVRQVIRRAIDGRPIDRA